MRTVIAIAALGFLTSCAETPSKPTTSGGSSSGSGKIVTATPEEPFDCDDDLILEPHLPEECIPPEPPEPVKPAEPPKPDPIVGTYQLFYPGYPTSEWVIRIYPNGTSNSGVLWERHGDHYRFFLRSKPTETAFRLTYSHVRGEPNISTTSDSKWTAFEGIKKSSDPKFKFDFYVLLQSKRGEISNHYCKNIGATEWTGANPGMSTSAPPNFAETLIECEALCPAYVAWMYDRAPLTNYTCPQDRR